MEVERTTTEDIDLPKGWKKEEVTRKSGLSAGKTDIYYYGPDGKKYRSKPQIARELGDGFDLTGFDFRSGKITNQLNRKMKSKKSGGFSYSKGLRGDGSFTLPVRQTASIFKQPVTVITLHPDSKTRHDIKHGNPDTLPPKQLFWERSLTGLNCCDITEEVLKALDLPSKIQGMEPDFTTENLLQSIAAALHLNMQPVIGQSQSQSKFLKNPTVHVNTNQPLVQQVIITEEDVRQQEQKVLNARKKLEEVLSMINKQQLLELGSDLYPDDSESSEPEEMELQDHLSAEEETGKPPDSDH